MRLSLYGEKVHIPPTPLRIDSDANNDRTKVFNRPRVKGPDNRPKARTQRLLRAFSKARYGRLTIADGEDTFAFEGSEPGPEAHITILDPQAWADVAFPGSVGGGEAYMGGYWVTSSLDQVIRFFVANSHLTDQLENGLTCVFRAVLATAHWLNKNTVKGSKKNIEAHYDLGNQLFETFLDPTLMYSSALFADGTTDLHDASIENQTTSAESYSSHQPIMCLKLELAGEVCNPCR